MAKTVSLDSVQKPIAATKTFKLLSGVECEISKMKTKHQGILTEQDGDVLEAFNTILADCIVRVGSNRSIDRDFVISMLSKDKKIALIELRKFSFSFAPTLTVEYEYLSKRTKRKEVEQVSVDIDTCLTSSPYQVFSVSNELVDATYEEYSDIKREFVTILPNGLKVAVILQDGKAEKRMSAIKRKFLDVNSQFKMAQCRKLVVMGDAGKEMPIELRVEDIDDLESSEFLRLFIRSIEATCETEIDFEHPENDGQIVTIDFMGSVNFLFPTGVR